jgi:aerobic-type carbon monoxide dehydrogenase small subunit (CoxS/CutS family)
MTSNEHDANPKKDKLSRRNFLIGAGAGGLVAAVAVAGIEEMRILSIKSPPGTTTTTTATTTVTTTVSGTGQQQGPTAISTMTLNVNGLQHVLLLDNRWTLAETLREKLNLIGTKLGCDRGECGSCAVLVDGAPMLSCLMLAIEAQGHQVTTIEGLGMPEKLSNVQTAFVDNEGLQCGACVPGFVVVGTAFLKANPNPSDADLKAAMSGNLCRCGNYPFFIQALKAVK